MTAAMEHDRSPTNPQGNNQHTAVPAMFHHCTAVFDAMMREAEQYYTDTALRRPVKVQDAIEQRLDIPPDSTKILVWEGFLTKLVGEELKLSSPYFSLVRNNLIAMDCVRQLQRGGGSAPSRWELLKAPNLDAFNAIREATGSSYGAVSKHLQKQTAGGEAVRTAQAASQSARDNARQLAQMERTQRVMMETINALLAALEEQGVEVDLDVPKQTLQPE